MKTTKGYALIDKQTGKIVWTGLKRPWYWPSMGDKIRLKLSRILITPERKKK
jgi:hypothetical protein